MTLASSPTSAIVLLENGDSPKETLRDRLTRKEFEQRYDAMPYCKKAEWIEGQVYTASPVRARKHGQPHAAVMTWLGTYWQATPGIKLMDKTVRLDADNEPQSDACWRIQERAGGRSPISEDDYIKGAPELIVEVVAGLSLGLASAERQTFRESLAAKLSAESRSNSERV